MVGTQLFITTAVLVIVFLAICAYLFTTHKLSPYVSSNVVPSNYTYQSLPNPGNLTQSQFLSYPQCTNATDTHTDNSTFSCSVGQRSGYFIVKSVNSNETISVYAYYIQPAQYVGETWSPEILTEQLGKIVFNQCGIKYTLSNISYENQYASFNVTPGSEGCPE
jgi:hypothetical protein